MAATTEHGERIARVEGAYEHLATKADVERMAATLTWRMILIGAIFQAIGIGAIKYLQ